MIKITNIKIDFMENTGCNNGILSPVKITLSNGKVYHGNTCRCCHGCHGSLNVPDIRTVFNSVEQFENYL